MSGEDLECNSQDDMTQFSVDDFIYDIEAYDTAKYSLQGTTQGNGLTGADMPVRFSM